MAEQLTVKQFAERAGISTQAIYARLASAELSPFVQVVQGKKTISEAALKLFECKPVAQVDCTRERKPLQDDITRTLILTLQKQLEEKDKQIEQAHAENAAILDRLEDVTAALRAAQQTADHAQALHAGTMKTAALIETREAGADQTGEKSKRGWKFWRR